MAMGILTANNSKYSAAKQGDEILVLMVIQLCWTFHQIIYMKVASE